MCEQTTRDAGQLARSPAEPCPSSSRTTAASSLSSPSSCCAVGGRAGASPVQLRRHTEEEERASARRQLLSELCGPWVRAASSQEAPQALGVGGLFVQDSRKHERRRGGFSRALRLAQCRLEAGWSRGAPGSPGFSVSWPVAALVFHWLWLPPTPGTDTPRECSSGPRFCCRHRLGGMVRRPSPSGLLLGSRDHLQSLPTSLLWGCVRRAWAAECVLEGATEVRNLGGGRAGP